MTDLILIATFILSIIAFVEIVRRRESPATQTYQTPVDAASGNGQHEDIPTILKRHSADDCLSVHLTTGATGKTGRDELYSLRPGAPLWLENCGYSDIECVKVYSEGYMIGKLLLRDAQRVIDLMQRCHIHGSYVAENNSSPDNIDMRIVLFYEADAAALTNEADEAAIDKAMASPYKITVDLLDETNLFQN